MTDRLAGQAPSIHIDQNLQTWIEMKQCSLPEYIRLSAKRCIKKHCGKYYRLLLCGTGVSSAVKRWYYADDSTKQTVAIQDQRPFGGTIWTTPE